MADLWQDLGDRIKFFGSDWTKYSIIGSFLLYMLGYLTLRFHLTAIGVGTDLAVLDERYLFAGARCFVYLVSSVPNIVLIALPVVLVTWAGSRLVSKPTRTRIRASVMYPPRLAVFGIVFAVFMIQFVMRQCFLFSNLFLTRELPVEPAWLVNLLLDDRLMPLFFSSMVAGCAVTVAILIALRRVEGQEVSVLTRGLLALLAGVQILLLPVNYGVLISDKSLPRVAALGKEPLAEGEEAWLVWEGKEGVTFLLRNQEVGRRTLITLRRSDVERIEIIGFDRILPTLFRSQHRGKG